MAKDPKRGPQTGTPPSLEFVAVDRLQVDPAYQRATDGPHSRKIVFGMVREWKWALCQPLVVARRTDGSLFILDGQHRHAGAIERGDIAHLPCVILSNIDQAGEATAFVDLNTKRQRLSQLDIFNGMLAAGDTNAIQTAALLEQTGWRIRRSSDTQGFKAGDLVCAPMLARELKRRGPAPIGFALAALRKADPDQPVTSTANLLTALIRIYTPKHKSDRMAQRLALRAPGLWISAGAEIAEGEGCSRINGLIFAIERAADEKPPAQKPKAPPAPPPAPVRKPAKQFSIAKPARIFDQENRAWCDQCQTRVTQKTAAQCQTRFCSLKQVA